MEKRKRIGQVNLLSGEVDTLPDSHHMKLTITIKVADSKDLNVSFTWKLINGEEIPVDRILELAKKAVSSNRFLQGIEKHCGAQTA